ncbi:MAG: hypothetical protein IJ266_05510, partial [Elusimicrobiaceae bacterium]|nr:hypothetical protein [Elusimicrobiaceae bacterium]
SSAAVPPAESGPVKQGKRESRRNVSGTEVLEMTKKTKNAHLIDADKNVDVIQAEVVDLLHKYKIID